MMITGERRDKLTMLKGLKPGYTKTKLLERNTIKAWYPDGTTIIRYWDTDVVTINPDGSIVLKSGGFMTNTTKRRIEDNTKIRIIQRNSIWYICRNIHEYPSLKDFGSMPLFYDGIHISDDGKILSGIKVSSESVIKQFKKDLKKLTDKITKEHIPYPDAGDCLICRFDMAKQKATPDHLIAHVKEGYLHGSLIALCLNLCGFKPAVHMRLKFDDNIRRCVRKVISDACIPVILQNPEIYTEWGKE
jgi:hypothetical protein